MFPSIEQLQSKFHEIGYVLDPVTIQQVYVASMLQKPILVERPPGSGKPELAKAVAFALDSIVERLQCYPGIKVLRSNRLTVRRKNRHWLGSPLMRSKTTRFPAIWPISMIIYLYGRPKKDRPR